MNNNNKDNSVQVSNNINNNIIIRLTNIKSLFMSINICNIYSTYAFLFLATANNVSIFESNLNDCKSEKLVFCNKLR